MREKKKPSRGFHQKFCYFQDLIEEEFYHIPLSKINNQITFMKIIFFGLFDF